ncbi:MAG: DUF1648 domain-containing protein [Cyclobacteriaceae bacterium]
MQTEFDSDKGFKWSSSLLIELTGIILILLFWVFTFFLFPIIPEDIPTHFNMEGKPDSFGSKTSVFLLPGIASVIFILLTVVNRRPERFNYPVIINEQNAESQYRLAGNFIRFLKIFIVLIFWVIFYFSTALTHAQRSSLGKYLLPVLLLLTFFPVLTYLIIASKHKS